MSNLCVTYANSDLQFTPPLSGKESLDQFTLIGDISHSCFVIGVSLSPSRMKGSRTRSPFADLNSRTQIFRKRTGLP